MPCKCHLDFDILYSSDKKHNHLNFLFVSIIILLVLTYHTSINHGTSISTKKCWKCIKTIFEAKIQTSNYSQLTLRTICNWMVSSRMCIRPKKNNPPESRIHWSNSCNCSFAEISFNSFLFSFGIYRNLFKL